MPDASLTFRKSSYSGGRTQDCVEVADASGLTAMRDSKHQDSGYLAFPAAEWTAFLDDVKASYL